MALMVDHFVPTCKNKMYLFNRCPCSHSLSQSFITFINNHLVLQPLIFMVLLLINNNLYKKKEWTHQKIQDHSMN